MKDNLIVGILAFSLLCFSGWTDASAGRQCAQTAQPLSPLLAEPLVFFGEIHGTNEIPDLVGSHLCALVASGRAVLLGLEIPAEEQTRIDAFLQSSGSAEQVQALLGGPHWRTARPDGRSSQAMLRLLELVRTLKQLPDSKVRVVAFDTWNLDPLRDTVMAKNLAAARASVGDESTVVLTGNLHALKTRGSRFDAEFESMAYVMRRSKPVTINVTPLTGTAWFCGPDCGVQTFSQKQATQPAEGLHLGKSLTNDYSGQFFIGRTSASLPALNP